MFNFTINFCASNATLAGCANCGRVLGRSELLFLCCSLEFFGHFYFDTPNGDSEFCDGIRGIDVDSYIRGRRTDCLGWIVEEDWPYSRVCAFTCGIDRCFTLTTTYWIPVFPHFVTCQRPPLGDLCGLVVSRSQGIYQPHDLLPFRFQTT
jgi:hypothetical protein